MSKKIIVCTNFRANPNHSSCAARGSQQVITALTLKLAQEKLSIAIEKSPCLGFCEVGPNLRLMPNGEFFHTISDKNLGQVIKKIKHFLKSDQKSS